MELQPIFSLFFSFCVFPLFLQLLPKYKLQTKSWFQDWKPKHLRPSQTWSSPTFCQSSIFHLKPSLNTFTFSTFYLWPSLPFCTLPFRTLSVQILTLLTGRHPENAASTPRVKKGAAPVEPEEVPVDNGSSASKAPGTLSGSQMHYHIVANKRDPVIQVVFRPKLGKLRQD